MKISRIIGLVTVIAVTTLQSASAAYTEVKCNTKPAFNANSCSQCFIGWAIWLNGKLGFLEDTWKNTSNVNKILFKDEQSMPKLINLQPSTVSWKAIPWNAGFWGYTDAFNKMYNNNDQGYILKKGEQVSWLASNTGHAYSLIKNQAPKWQDIGLLVYSLSSHNIASSWEVEIDANVHTECVAFQSGVAGTKIAQHTSTATNPKPWKATARVAWTAQKLPDTGPEHYLLVLLLALILGFGITKMRKKA